VSPPRVLLAKPGLDGHDRGIKVIAMALRDAGDVDVIGISVLSGAHVALAADLLRTLDHEGLAVPVVIGGTIPERDAAALGDLGVAAVYPVGTGLHEVVAGVLELATRERVQR
jgi:methylmalonyl-CoA mutase, C-terminal domain